MSEFYNQLWLEQDQKQRSSLLKRLVYHAARPLLSAYGRSFLTQETLTKISPRFVLPGRGMPLEYCCHWASKKCKVSEATILVQGTGTGWDVLNWARLHPKRIIATDLFEFSDSWEAIAAYCHDKFSVNVEFHQSPLEDHSFLSDKSIDLCVSTSVFEHCRDLKSVLVESLRLLKLGGTLYATYGPLWFCGGGDHFSGRGGIQNIFNHLLLDDDKYKEYFQMFLVANEDFQSGGRYVELDLFSRLTTQQYCQIFQDTGFKMDEIILYISKSSVKFQTQFSDQFNQLQKKCISQCIRDDFLIFSNYIRLIKP